MSAFSKLPYHWTMLTSQSDTSVLIHVTENLDIYGVTNAGVFL